MTPSDMILLLLRHGWTQAEIAERAGLSQPTVSRLYAGTLQDPKHSTVVKLQELVQELRDLDGDQ